MVQCDSAMGGAALLRLSLLYRMLRAGEVLALVALVSWTSWYVPSALRLAGSLLLNARFVFFLGNAIVLLLFALSRHDLSSSPASSNEQPSTASTATTTPQQVASPSVAPPVADASASSFGSFTTTPSTPTPPSSSMGVGPAAAAAASSFATPAAPPERERVVVPRADMMLLEDKQQLVVRSKARAPRRSRSEKMGRRAASPELRRCESENGRRRRSSVNAEACSWGREDADEFRRTVEAFIARQTRFHREESMRHCHPDPAFSAALAVVE